MEGNEGQNPTPEEQALLDQQAADEQAAADKQAAADEEKARRREAAGRTGTATRRMLPDGAPVDPDTQRIADSFGQTKES